MTKIKTKKELIKVDGRLKEITTIHDEKGRILHKIVSPLKVKFYFRDFLQVIIGASILAIPVGFTEETWQLGGSLPTLNVALLVCLSVLFISAFVYHHYYQKKLKHHWPEFVKRVFFTYVAAFLIVAVILTLIERTPWLLDVGLSVKRVAIVSFPASMSAAIADVLK